MIFIGSILLFLYLITLMVLLIGYQKIKESKFQKTAPTISFTIIIPFRNEAKDLPNLLKSIATLNYTKQLFEVIFVDDESTDHSVDLIEKAELLSKYRIIKNRRISNSPKKDALTEAIKIAKYDWVVTTDADCVLPENWLLNFNQFILEENPNMIAGPVAYQKKKGLINAYQQLDNASLQTVTISGFGLQTPLLCNGANLAYRKDVFNELSGFSGNLELASGDDIFLMEKFKKKDKNKVRFLKNKGSLVITVSENSWKDIINQRIRWASKTTKQKNIATQLLGSVVFSVNLYLLIGIIYSIYSLSFLKIFFGFLFIKLFADLIFNSSSIRFLNYTISIKNYLISFLTYPIITIVVVLKSLFGTYNWKGRSFKL